MPRYKADDLIDSIETFSNIRCSLCKVVKTEMADAYDCYEDLFKDGWRQTSVYTYCPKCAKKKLKS